jgi:hypothetical protein
MPNDDNSKKKLTPSEVRLFKMVDGSVVISYAKKTINSWILDFPLTLAIFPCFDSRGKITGTDVTFKEWIDGADEVPITIDSKVVLAITKPSLDILKLYMNEYSGLGNDDDVDQGIFTEEDIEAAEDMLNNDQLPNIFEGMENPFKPKSPRRNGPSSGNGKNANKKSGLTGGIPPQERITDENEFDDLDGNRRDDPPNFPL